MVALTWFTLTSLGHCLVMDSLCMTGERATTREGYLLVSIMMRKHLMMIIS